MTAMFGQADHRFPFFWESSSQPAARWHGDGEGPVQYLSSSPNGAWAEYLRHEGITDPADLAGVRRIMWMVDVVEPEPPVPAVYEEDALGDLDSYPACQEAARRLRENGAESLRSMSAALKRGEAAGWHTDSGLVRAADRDEIVYALFGRRPEYEAWRVASDARPHVALLSAVRHFGST